MAPPTKPAPERQLYVPHPDDADLFAPDAALDEPIEVDGEAYARWLETGEGEDPCRVRSS
ncbi:MAG: hypothetical protein IT373_10725 [Polyangiaceae bacterium]|nr:hypothetical protein [Polyangiaceae bacterium]